MKSLQSRSMHRSLQGSSGVTRVQPRCRATRSFNGSEQATLDPDQLLARFLWEEEPAKQRDAQQDVSRFLWDEVPAKQVDAPQLARFLWRDASPTALPSNQELQWSEQATLDPDQLLARFLWEEEPAKQRDAQQDVSRFLWDEVPAKQVDAPQLARFLWRDASPTALPSNQELQWSEQASLDPDQLLARFLWEEEPAKQRDAQQDVSRFLWDEEPASNKAKNDVQINPAEALARNEYIASGKDLSEMKRAAEELGIKVTHELPLINSLAFSLTAAEMTALRARSEVANLFASAPLRTANVSTRRQGDSANDRLASTDKREHFEGYGIPKTRAS